MSNTKASIVSICRSTIICTIATKDDFPCLLSDPSAFTTGIENGNGFVFKPYFLTILGCIHVIVHPLSISGLNQLRFPSLS